MPSGRIHAATTVALSLAAGVGAYTQNQPVPVITALAGGCLAGLLLSPDLDVDQGSISMKFARRSFGCLVGLIWAIYWKPYSAIIPHRSWLSHLPVISTALRLLYMALPYLAWQWWQTRQIGFTLPDWFYLAFLGLCLSDLAHWAMDNTIRG